MSDPRSATGTFADRAGLMLAVLDWVLDEQISGRRPNDHDVAAKFGLTLLEAIEVHDEPLPYLPEHATTERRDVRMPVPLVAQEGAVKKRLKRETT